MLFFLPQAGKAQELLVTAQLFTMEDGLSDRSVSCIAQDEMGLIWVGTENGLNLFDGSKFRKVEVENKQLSAYPIYGIKKSKSGEFWIKRSIESVLRFDPKTKKLLPLEYANGQVPKYLDLLSHTGQSKNIYFISDEKKIYYLNKDNKIALLNDKIHLGDTRIWPSNQHTILTKNRKKDLLKEYDADGTIIHTYRLEGGINHLFIEEENQLDINLWTAKVVGKSFDEILFSYDENKEIAPINLLNDNEKIKILDLVTAKKHINFRLTKDSKGNTYLGSSNFLFLFGKDGNLIKDLTAELSSFTTYEWTSSHMFVDNEDRLWIATGLGLFLIQTQNTPFQCYFENENSLSVRGILELPDNRIFMGSYEGARIFDKETEEVFSFIDQYVLGVTLYQDHKIIGGIHGPIIFEYDLKNKKWKRKKFVSGLKLQSTIPFFHPPNGNIFLGTTKGLYFAEHIDAEYEKYNKLNGFTDLDNQAIKWIFSNQEGLWLATTNGVFFT